MAGNEGEPERRPSIYVGVGIGAYRHEAEYPPLREAVPEVNLVGKILGQHEYETHLLEDLDKIALITRLEETLAQDKLPCGGSLVVLWSGHGEPAERAGLYLVDRNKAPNSSTPLSVVYVADLAARTGANQVLLIFDTCY